MCSPLPHGRSTCRSGNRTRRRPPPSSADLRIATVGGPASIVTSIERRRQLGSGSTSRLLQGLLLDLPHLHPARTPSTDGEPIGQTDPVSDEPESGIGALVQRVIRWLDQFQQRHSFVGFCYAVIKKYGDDSGGKQAALITYYGFLSIFPILLLAAVTVTNVLAGDPELRGRVITSIVPAELRDTVDAAVTSLPTGGLPLAIGIVGLLLSGTGVVFSTQDALNQLAGVSYRRRFDWFPRYVRSFAMLAVLLVSVLAIGALAVVAAELPDVGQAPRIVSAAGILVVCFIMLVAAAKLLIAGRTPFGSLWPAAATGAIVVTAILLVLGPLLTRFVTQSGPVYGSFATIVGLFALLYLVTQALVYCAEVAVVRHARLWPRALDTTHLTTADQRALTRLARVELRTLPQQITVSFDPDPDPDSDSDSG